VQQEIWSNSNTRVSAQCGGVPECVFFGLQVTYPITPTCFHERILARRTLQQPGSKHHSMICVVAHALADAERCSSVGAPLTCIVQPGPSQSFGVPVQRNKMRPTFSSCSLAAQPTADYFSSSSSCRYTTNRERERERVKENGLGLWCSSSGSGTGKRGEMNHGSRALHFLCQKRRKFKF
jgi:hypothetical protein